MVEGLDLGQITLTRTEDNLKQTLTERGYGQAGVQQHTCGYTSGLYRNS